MALEQEQTQAPTLPAADALGNPSPAAMAKAPQAGISSLSDAAPNVNEPSLGATFGDAMRAKGVDVSSLMPKPVSPFVANMAKGSDAATKILGSTAAAPGGAWRAILAGTMHALSGGLSGLGDVSAVGTVPEGAGALTGIARTLGARSQRQSQEKENLSKEKTQELLRAETTQRIAANTRNVYRQAQEDRKAAYAQGSKFVDSNRLDHETQDNINQSQLNDMLKKDPNFWLTHTGRAVDEEPVFNNGKPAIDKDGNPVMSPLYSVFKTQAKDGSDGKHITTESESKFYELSGHKIPPKTPLNIHEYDLLNISSTGVHQAQAAIEKANDEEMATEQARQLNSELQDPQIQHYIAMNPGEPLGGLYQAKKNIQAHMAAIDKNIADVQQKVPNPAGGQNPIIQTLQQQKQKFADQGQKVDHVISAGFTEKAKDDYIKRIDEQRKQDEVERHDKEDEANKRAEIKAKKGDFLGDPNAATPEAYLNSLDPEARSVVQLIGTGKAPLNNPSYLLARKPEIMEAVAKAYPDFDISKIKGYQETYIDFTKGKTSVELKSGDTALKHLRELQALNTTASHFPHSSAWTAYQNKVDTLSTELAKFYGDATVPGIANIKETLSSTLPGNRQAAISTQAQSMGDRLDSTETRWSEAAPSKEYEAKMPGISLQGKQARAFLDPAYAQKHPELGIKSDQQTVAPSSAPQGATLTYKDAQGNVKGWAVNGKYVPAGQ